MPPVAAMPAVLLSPATGEPRTAQAPSPPEAIAHGAERGAGEAFGRAFGEAMKELDSKASPGARHAGARGDRPAADASAVATAAADPAPAAPVPFIAPMPPPGLPAGLPVEAGGAAQEAVVGAVIGGVAAIAGLVPTGKVLPPGDDALPRVAPAAPATASGGAPDALAWPAAAVPAVASAGSSAAAVAPPPVAAANPELPSRSPPGARADTPRQATPAPAQAQASPGPAVDAQPLPQGVPAAAPKPGDAPPLPLASVDAGTLRRRAAAVSAAVNAGADGAVPAAGDALTGLAHAVAATAPAASPPSADAGGPGSARPGSPPRRTAPVPDNAAAAPAPGVPVAGSSAGAAPEPFAVGGDGATDLLVPRATLLRPAPHLTLPPGEQQGAPGPTPASGQGADHGATPWLQALAQARELAEEPASPSRDRDGTDALQAVAGERPGGAAMTLPAPGLAGLRAEAGPGTGILALPLAVGHASAQWASELEARVQWMAGRNLGAAEIRLDPPELGPLQVQVQTHRDGASVHFTTHSAAVRDLVEQSLPRLREMLESGGMSLVDVNVAQQQGGRGERDGLPASPGGPGVARESGNPAAVATVAVTARGLVDAYA